MSGRRRRWVIGAVLAAALAPRAGAQGDDAPRLLLFLTVDQLRFDYLRRLEGEFTGGLARLMRESASFEQAFHGHAVTTTGPGHASLATGRHPAHTGIVDNQWYDRRMGRTVNCVADPSAEVLNSSLPGRSPVNLLADTVADWIKASRPGGKSFGVSRKDRGAILPAGRNADGAFWFDADSGRFVTSSYYMAREPDWMHRLQEAPGPERYFGLAWEPLPVSESALERGDFAHLDSGDFREGLPRALGGLALVPDSGFYSDFGNSPLMDAYMVEFAKALLQGEALGRDDALDFLGLSFSALDSVGHDYGPNSPEVVDTLLRLDRALGELLSFLDEQVGAGRYAVTLSADHGVVPLPEFQASRRLPGRRFSTADVLCFQRAGLALQRKFGRDQWFLHGLYLNYEALGRRNLRRSEVENFLAAELQSCGAVRKVWTRTQLLAEADGGDPFLRLYRNSFQPERSPDLALQLPEYWLASGGRGTTHGSPYEYDRHVPLLVFFPGTPAARIAQPVETVDLAPTLCSLLGLTCPPDLDGRDRSGLLQTAGAAVP